MENNYIRLPKIEFVKLTLHRDIKGNEIIKNITVEKDTYSKILYISDRFNI